MVEAGLLGALAALYAFGQGFDIDLGNGGRAGA